MVMIITRLIFKRRFSLLDASNNLICRKDIVLSSIYNVLKRLPSNRSLEHTTLFNVYIYTAFDFLVRSKSSTSTLVLSVSRWILSRLEVLQ